MVYFRRGIVTSTKGNTGVIRELSAWETKPTGPETVFNFADVRFLEVNSARSELTFGTQYQPLDNGVTHVAFRDPVVGDIVMYDSRVDDGVHRVIKWTYEVHYTEAQAKLPRCTTKGCDNPRRFLRYNCNFHAPLEDDDSPFDHEEPDEDPLAGDVERTGGYYEPPVDPREAHRLEVMRQHGD